LVEIYNRVNSENLNSNIIMTFKQIKERFMKQLQYPNFGLNKVNINIPD